MTVCQYRNFDQIKATNLSLQWITLKKFHVWPIWQMAAWGVGNSFKNWLLKSCLSNKNFRCFWWAEITKTTTCCRKLPADRLIMNNMRFQRHSLTKIFQRNQIRATVWTFRLLWLQKADQPVVQVWSRCFRGKPEHTIPCWSLSFSPPHLKCYFTLDLFLDSCHQYIQSEKMRVCLYLCMCWMNSSQHRNQLWAEMNCGR